MHIRIVTFGLNIPAEAYTAHAVHIAPEFTGWPGLLGKWWLGDTASGTFGGCTCSSRSMTPTVHARQAYFETRSQTRR
jgi:hypothetical protein